MLTNEGKMFGVIIIFLCVNVCEIMVIKVWKFVVLERWIK
jgi:hypothetical protein